MEHQNKPGRITLDLITFLREVHVWYLDRKSRSASFPAPHSYFHPIVSIASKRRAFGSLRFDHAQETCSFERAPGETRVAVTISLQGEHLGFALYNTDLAIVGVGIVHLADNGKALIRLNTEDEIVECQIDLQAMQSPLVTVDALMDFVRDKRNTLFPERSGETLECFVDLRNEVTLQTFATIHKWTRVRGQPIIVDSLFEAVRRQFTSSTPSFSLTRPSSFEAEVCRFLLEDEHQYNGGESLILLAMFDERARAWVVGSSSAVVAQIKNTLEHNHHEITSRIA